MITNTALTLSAAALLAAGSTGWAAQPSSDEVRATVAEMMADAETRSSLLSSGDAGHDGKFFIAGDGFRLNIGGQIQARYYVDFRDDSATDDGFESGFQMRIVKLNFQGDINKDWFYRIRGNFSQSNGDLFSEFAYLGHKFANGTRFIAGQFKLPLLREELVDNTLQLAAERSITNVVFTQAFSQGVMLDRETENWRVAGAFSDGLATTSTVYTDNQTTSWFASGNGLGEADYAFTGRFEYMFSGGWKMFDDFTSAKGQDFGAMLGIAGHWQESANTANPADVDTDTGELTVDISLEGDSWNLFGAYILRYNNYSTLGAGDNDLTDHAFIIQGGWRFAENTELFARWDAIFADEDNVNFGSDDTFNFLTAGLNQYYAGHAAKATLDLVWSFDKTDSLVSAGVLPNAANGLLGSDEENEVVVRAQFQLLF